MLVNMPICRRAGDKGLGENSLLVRLCQSSEVLPLARRFSDAFQIGCSGDTRHHGVDRVGAGSLSAPGELDASGRRGEIELQLLGVAQGNERHGISP
jgi:hypothetical protein